MTETPIAPATDQVDYRSIAYNAAVVLAELTHSLDPRLRVTCDIGPQGETSLFLIDAAAALLDAQQLATRLGLEAHDTAPVSLGVRHTWTGCRGGFRVTVRFIDEHPEQTCSCGKPVQP